MPESAPRWMCEQHLLLDYGEGPRAVLHHCTGLHAEAGSRLAGGVHDEGAVHAHVRDSPRGTLERRGTGHCSGLRLHTSRDPQAPAGYRRRPPESSLRAPRWREDGASRAPIPCRRMAVPLRFRPSAARARGRGSHEGLGRPDGQSEDRGSHRKRPLPRRALGAREAAHAASEILATGASTSRISTGWSSGSARRARLHRPPRCSRHPSGQRRLRSEPGSRHRSRAPADPGCQSAPDALVGMGARQHPCRPGRASGAREQARTPRARLRHRSGRARAGACGARSIRRTGRARAPCSSTRLAGIGRTGPSTATVPSSRAACSSRRAAGGEPDGIYDCAGSRLSLRLLTFAGVTWRERDLRADPGSARQIGVEALPTFVTARRSNQILRAATSTSSPSPGSRLGNPRSARSVLRLRRLAELQRLLPASRDDGPRSGRPHPRRGSRGTASSTAPTGRWRRTYR